MGHRRQFKAVSCYLPTGITRSSFCESVWTYFFPRIHRLACDLQHEYVATHHFLIALAEAPGTVTDAILNSYDLSRSVILDEVTELDPLGTMNCLMGKLGFTARSLHAIAHAANECTRIESTGALITEDHLFLGVTDASENVVAQILARRQLSAPIIRQEVLEYLGDHVT